MAEARVGIRWTIGTPAELEYSSDSGPRPGGEGGKPSPEDGRADWHFLSLWLESLEIKKEKCFHCHRSSVSSTIFWKNEVQFIYFSFVTCDFGDMSEKRLSNLRLWKFTSRSSPKSFTVLLVTLTLGSLTHFEDFLCVVRQRSDFTEWFISGLSVLFHWPMCMFFSQYHAVLSTVTL